MLDLLPKPAVIAHRGASVHAPENTLSSFRLAISQQADAIELDVQLSKDHHVVVFHDRLLDRTTRASGPVSKQPLSKLHKLEAGIAYGSLFIGETIPTLDEVLSEFSNKIYFNIEIKEYTHPWGLLPAKVIEIIQSKNAEENVLISSFNPSTILETHKLSPSIPKGLIIHGLPVLIWLQLGLSFTLPVQSIHLSSNILTPSVIGMIHKTGRKIFSYTLNHPTLIQKAFHLGVDGFFTDNPALAKRVLSSEQQLS